MMHSAKKALKKKNEKEPIKVYQTFTKEKKAGQLFNNLVQSKSFNIRVVSKKEEEMEAKEKQNQEVTDNKHLLELVDNTFNELKFS